jgi:hypothetical protein
MPDHCVCPACFFNRYGLEHGDVVVRKLITAMYDAVPSVHSNLCLRCPFPMQVWLGAM